MRKKPLDLSKLEPTKVSNQEEVSEAEIVDFNHIGHNTFAPVEMNKSLVNAVHNPHAFMSFIGLEEKEEKLLKKINKIFYSLTTFLEPIEAVIAIEMGWVDYDNVDEHGHPIINSPFKNFKLYSFLLPSDTDKIISDLNSCKSLTESIKKLNLTDSIFKYLQYLELRIENTTELINLSKDDDTVRKSLESDLILYTRRFFKHLFLHLYLEKGWKHLLFKVGRKGNKYRIELIKELKKGEYPLRFSIEDISDILEGIRLIYPEFKFPEIHYQGRALVNNLNPMAGGAVITSGCKASRDQENWVKDSVSGIAYFEHRKSDMPNSVITHYLRDFNSEEIKAIPFNEATQILEKFGSQTALLHLILAVHTYSRLDPTSAQFRLKGTDLIHDLGLAKRTDLSTNQKLKLVLDSVNAVRSLLIKAEWQGEKQKGQKTITVTCSVQPSIMWDLSPKVESQKDLFGNEKFEEIYIECKIGSWINHFFNEAGHKMGEALYNFATLAQNILQLDPYHEELALRIALLQSTMPYRSYITVEHWLEENLLGYKDKISKARTDKRHRKKLKDLWDKTLLALERIGFDIHFDEESYPSQLRPNGKVPRGYFEQWLKAKIKITPQKLDNPESAIERLERLEREEPKKLTPTKTYSGSELKKARTANKLTQEMIAKYLQCSKGTISKLEKKSSIPLKKYKEMIDAINFVAKTPEKFK